MLSEKSLKKDFRVLRRNIDEALESFNDSTYLTITAYDCPFALVFVDEATRWKEVVPFEDKTILSHMKAFLHYRNHVMDAMAKLQLNPKKLIRKALLEKTKKALREKVSLKKVSNQNLSLIIIIIIIIIISLSFGFRVREDEEEHFCAVVFA